MKLNENILKLSENYLFSDIAKKRKAYIEKNPDKKVISLGIGDVTLPFPKIIIDALTSASMEMGVKETFKGYPPEYGYDFLRERIKNYYLKRNVNLDINSIFVSDGAKSDLGNILDILGDNKALIPNPVYPVYLDSNLMAGREVILIDGNKDNGFKPLPPKDIKGESIIYLCSPNNPTGAVYNYDELKMWVDYANKNESLIIFDAAYEAFISGDYPHSIYEIEGSKTCAIEICSFSKLAGFTGLRSSWTVVPTEIENGKLNRLWARRQATKFNGVAWPVQKASDVVLSDEGLKECHKNISYYKENARIIAEVLKKHNIYFVGGTDSPYIWMKCPFNMKSWEFFDYLLENASIIGTPGVGFGTNGEGYFRLTSFSTRENTIEAAKRLDTLLGR